MFKINNSKQIQLTIGNFADILGVHQRTLRIWDEKGVLTPQRTEKNRRYYTLCDVKKAQFILFLMRNLFLNIAAVKIIMGLFENSNVDVNDYIEYVDKIAKAADIGENKQDENRLKSLKRGRRKTN